MERHADCINMEKKIIILGNAAINNGNRGCVALAYCAINLIDNALGNGNYDLFLTESLEEDGEHYITINDKIIKYKSISVPSLNTIMGLINMVLNFKKYKYGISVLKKASMFFDIGQGDSFADIYGKDRFYWIDQIHFAARLMGKPYVLLPQTIGPFKNEKIKKLADKSIKKAAFVMTRDYLSYEYIRKYIPEQECTREYIDVAFFLPYKKREFDKTKVHVGLNISALLWYGGYTNNNQFALKCNYRNSIRNIVNYFLSLENVILHLVPHVVGQERSVENDYAVSFDLYEEYKSEKIVLAPFFMSPINAKDYISGLDFFIGARMHATIAAFSSGIPVIPMAYSRKFNGLFKETLLYDNIVDMKEMGDTELFDTIKEGFVNRLKIREVIMDRTATVVEERKRQLLSDLFNLLCNENR